MLEGAVEGSAEMNESEVIRCDRKLRHNIRVARQNFGPRKAGGTGEAVRCVLFKDCQYSEEGYVTCMDDAEALANCDIRRKGMLERK